jgi:glutamyl-tRNA synthetase
MPGLKERAKTILELASSAEFLYTDGPRTLDEAAAKVLTGEARGTLGQLVSKLSATDWTVPALEEAARTFAEGAGLKLGQVAQPLRAALTGRTQSPPIFDVLAILGKDESLVRLGAYTA